jgi:hypothetical protein
MHLGQTVTFTGAYRSDHIERSYVWPNGCHRAIDLGQISPEANKILDSVDDRTYEHRIEATFTGTLVQEEREVSIDYRWWRDDGVRLNISKITDLKITDRGSD